MLENAKRAISKTEFANVLRTSGILDSLPPRVGLQVSGDASSMALAYMMRRQFPSMELYSFTFIPTLNNNDSKFNHIRKQLNQHMLSLKIHHSEIYGIPDNSICHSHNSYKDDSNYQYIPGSISKNLNIDVSKLKTSTSTFAMENDIDFNSILKSSSREGRISAISAAADKYEITHFVSAETLEDRIARCIYRMKRNSGLSGLSGMEHISTMIPSMMAIPRPIVFLKPLLKFSKERCLDTLLDTKYHSYPLISPLKNNITSYEHGLVKFFMHLDKDSANEKNLPKALTMTNMSRFVENFATYSERLERATKDILAERAVLDPPTGSCFLDVRVPRYILNKGEDISAKVRKSYLGGEYVSFEVVKSICRKIIWKTHPPPSKVIKRLQNFIFKSNGNMSSEVGAGVLICVPKFKTGIGVYTISREPFQKNNYPISVLKLNEKTLFDNRFIISVLSPEDGAKSNSKKFGGIPDSDLKFIVKPFTIDDYKVLKSRITLLKSKSTRYDFELLMSKYLTALEHFYNHMPTKSRTTVPCIAIKAPNAQPYVAYVPCLGITLEPDIAAISQQSLLHTEPNDWTFY